MSDKTREDRWGCPEWRDSEQYEDYSKMIDDWRWRWEFLRRLPAYRTLWANPDEKGDVFTSQPILDQSTDQREKLIFGYGINNLINPSVTNSILVENPFNDLSGQVAFAPVLGLDFELVQDDDPTIALDYAKTASRRQDMGYFCVEFDVKRPIDAQLLRARESLMRIRALFAPDYKQLKVARRESWPRHLRLVDAKDQGATHAEIYEHFAREQTVDDDELDEFYRFGTQPKALVSQWLKQAQEVMDKASRFL